MNLEHLKSFIWLRYRLRVNQLKRGGIANKIVLTLLVVAGLAASIGMFFGGLLVGLFAFRIAPPMVRLLVWDVLVAVFLFVWMIALLTDLQRTDAISLDKFLHLPVSPFGAFLVNYLSTLSSLSLIVFVPGMVGLILGQTFAEGPQMLLAFPLLAAFVLAVTALTYQFQGWLASLMTNPRRRRTVVVVITMSFVLLFQFPNLINVFRPWENKSENPRQGFDERLNELNESFRQGQLSKGELQEQSTKAREEYEANREQTSKEDWARAERTARIINTALPPAWLPLGAADLGGRAVMPALLGTLGLALVGSLSLWRAYRTTLRIYTGHDSGGGKKVAARGGATPAGPPPVRLIEWRLPGVAEQPAAVALAAFRSLLRAPEAKMALILPVILAVVFAGLFVSLKAAPPQMVRPLIGFGVIAMVLVCSVQIASNQFGYDRAGFRAYVLSPISRRDILLGKNLAVAPIALGLSAIALVVIEIVCPMRIDHFLAAFAQAVSMFLLFCLLTNVVSIIAPLPIAPGAMKATQVKLVPVLAHVGLMFAFPIVNAPLLIPLGLEALLAELTGVTFLPLALPLTLVLLIGVVFIYRRGMNVLGQLLADREQRILEVVTSKLEG